MSSYYEKFLATGEVKCIDEEIPFEIPKGWEWERIGNIFFVTKLAGFEYAKFFTKEALSVSNPIPIVRAQNVRMGFFEENKNEAISEMLSSQLERSALTKKCLLMTFIGAGIGDTCIFPAERRNHLAPNVAKIEPLDDIISLDYIVFALMSPCGQRGVNAIKKSTAQPSLSMETIRKLLIPIPSLREQKRISLKLSEAVPLVEKYSKVQEEQNQLNAEIQNLLKKSILQEAIQGKLVPQIAEEGTAPELLEQIRQEKQRLVKEGKLKKSALTDSVIFKGDDNKYWEKKDKTEKDITDGIPFEIPDSWVWVRHNDLFDISGGSQPPKSKFIEREKEGYIRLFQIRDYGSNPQPIYIPLSTASKISQKGDILLARYGASLGKVFYAEYGAYNVALAKVIPLYESRLIFQKYIFLYYCSSIYQNEIVNRSRCAQAGFNREDLNSLLFPLPPLSEQYRIVEKYEKAIASIIRG